MTKKYTDILFDLDRTLWDFNTNSHLALEILFQEFDLIDYFGNKLFFTSRFEYHNKKLWQAYYQNRIDKEVLIYRRFYLCLKEAGKDNLELSKEIAQAYLDTSAMQTRLIPNAKEILDYLKSKSYRLHIITNGFNEVQYKKLKNSGIYDYFDKIISSEDAGANKPLAKIFSYACQTINTNKENCIIIGDDINTDIKGAMDFGMDNIYFNPEYRTSKIDIMYETHNLLEIKKII